ncbi:hypothetical protein Z968_13195 [Clostridium novyi A str. 4552]|uniref:MobA-like NTP transferase domain-containing protein n=1 Tax=Clostridium novyi A str. 4552 TaxID=1444289 RepID=A0A0A0HZL4_CLONO|nr:NTP transferase domain-containing protein [Clostridium novyi]KGM92775.1 hypothetical protein Z968_13195 [Clostridium novyi A str. 4552]
MKAIILNAGKSEKLSEDLRNKPKCLLEIENNSILEIQLNILYNCGINDVSVVRGYCKEDINIPGIKYYDNKYYDSTNVLYSLFCAEEELNDDVLIIYGDILFTESTINRITDSKHDIAIGVMTNTDSYFKDRYVDYTKKEMLIFDAQNNVEQIGKGLLNISDSNSGLFTGIIKCTKRGCDILKNNYNRIIDIKETSTYLNEQKIKKYMDN